MKIGIYLYEDLNPSAGGNFSYNEKLIDVIDKYQFKEPLQICFIGRSVRSKFKLEKEYISISSIKTHRFFKFLKRIKILKIVAFIFGSNPDLSNRSDMRVLKKNGVDAILYSKHFSHEVDNFPFFTINWDIGHKTTFLFPEFIQSFDIRERWYRSEIQKALGVIVESEASRSECIQYIPLAPSKIGVVHLFAGGVIDLKVSQEAQAEFIKSFGLSNLRYFLYPAQFWACKNHYNLIIGFQKLLSDNSDKSLRLVFTGSDAGNMNYIEATIEKLGLKEKVIKLGFVSDEALHALYRHSVALVMPTFLGPTNMPVLEALALQIPVICSDLEGHREICGDGALYADPAQPLQWTAAMQTLLDNETRTLFIKRGIDRYATSPFKIGHALQNLEEFFLKFAPIRQTFE